MKQLQTLSRREREIMDIVFGIGAGCATATEVRERMPDAPSYSAVRATMRILEHKGLLRHEHDGKRYVYRPTLHPVKARKNARSSSPYILMFLNTIKKASIMAN